MATRTPPQPRSSVGASQGGGRAAAIALTGDPFSCRGLVAVVSAYPDVPDVSSAARDAGARGLRAYLLTGDRDTTRDQVEHLYADLLAGGVQAKQEVVPDLGARVPRRLSRAPATRGRVHPRRLIASAEGMRSFHPNGRFVKEAHFRPKGLVASLLMAASRFSTLEEAALAGFDPRYARVVQVRFRSIYTHVSHAAPAERGRGRAGY